MKRIRFSGVLEISEDMFEGEFDSEVDALLVHAFDHGDSSGDFFTYSSGDVTVEDYEENA